MVGLDIIAYVGGWAALTVALALFLGKFFAQTISDNLKIKWSREQEEKLEQLRAEITREHSIFTTILNSYSSSHHFSQSNRIKAVQTLWGNVLETRKLGDFPLLFFGILLESEYNTVYDNDKIMSGLKSLSFDNTVGKIPQIKETVEKYRPFLGEHLWSLFVIYTILVGRVSYLLIDGRDKKNIKSWHKDLYIQSILNKVFDEEERNLIISQKIGSFEEATRLLEQKILFETSKITSGELAAERDLSKAKNLQDLITLTSSKHREHIIPNCPIRSDLSI